MVYVKKPDGLEIAKRQYKKRTVKCLHCQQIFHKEDMHSYNMCNWCAYDKGLYVPFPHSDGSYS